MAWLWSCGFPGTCPFDEPTVCVWLASSLTHRCHPITTSPVSPLTVAPPTTPMLLQVTFSIPHPMSSLFIPTTTNQKNQPQWLVAISDSFLTLLSLQVQDQRVSSELCCLFTWWARSWAYFLRAPIPSTRPISMA